MLRQTSLELVPNLGRRGSRRAKSAANSELGGRGSRRAGNAARRGSIWRAFALAEIGAELAGRLGDRVEHCR